ncbi:MAG: DUF6186 family protein [Acidimicrobiales bacterium]
MIRHLTCAGGALGVVIGSDKAIGLLFWVTVIAAVTTLEVIARAGHRNLPSLADLIERYLPHPVVRAAAIGLWLYAGWHLFSH